MTIKVNKPDYTTEEEDFAFSDGLRAGVTAVALKVNKLINTNAESKGYIEVKDLKYCLDHIWTKDDAVEKEGEQ